MWECARSGGWLCGGGCSSRNDETEAIKPLSAGAVDTGNTVSSGRNQAASVNTVSKKFRLCVKCNRLPATTVLVAIPLTATTAAGQNLNTVNPETSSQIEAQQRFAESCIDRELVSALLTTSLSEQLILSIFIHKLDAV